MTETKNEEFQRLAKKRAEKVAEELRKIGSLSSPIYKYEEDQVAHLFEYIQHRVQEARKKFTNPSSRSAPSLEF